MDVRHFIKRNENKFFDLSLDNVISENKTALELVQYASLHNVRIYKKGKHEIRDITNVALAQAISYCLEKNLMVMDIHKMLRAAL